MLRYIHKYSSVLVLLVPTPFVDLGRLQARFLSQLLHRLTAPFCVLLVRLNQHRDLFLCFSLSLVPFRTIFKKDPAGLLIHKLDYLVDQVLGLLVHDFLEH